MRKAITSLSISILLVVFMLGLLSYQFNYQSYNQQNNIQRLDANMMLMYENLDYQIIQMRSHILANATIVDSGTPNGRYFPSNMNILVYGKGRPIKSVHDTAIHEIGHYIFHEELTIDERSEWYNMTFDCYPSDYAETNSGENFAESYQHWYHNNLTCQPQLDLFNKIKDRLQ